MNKNKLLLLPILSLSLLSSCGNPSKKISIFLYNEHDDFLQSLNSELLLKFINDYEITTNYAEESQVLQNEQLSNDIDNNTNLILANIVDRLSASSFIEKASKHDIPIIFFNREPLKEDVLKEKNVYYVGTDAIFEGKGQASLVNKCFGGPTKFANSKFDKNKDGKVQIYLLKGEQGHQDTEFRSKIVLEELNNLGYEIELLQSQFCDWKKDKTYLEFGKSYDDFQNSDGSTKIELLLSNNDSMALGAIDYIKDNIEYNTELPFMDTFFPIIGTNGETEAIKAIKDGYLFGTVKNNASAQANEIYKLAVKLINKQKIKGEDFNFVNDRFIYTKGEIIDIENYFPYL